MLGNGQKFAAADPGGALRQGEILTELRQVILDLDSPATNPKIIPRRHPFAIVVSQDCDLDLDFKSRNPTSKGGDDKTVPSVLFCEMVTAEELRGSAEINSTIWSLVRTNQHQRYQFFEAVPPVADLANEGLPETGLDFKRFFTVPTEDVYEQLGGSSTKRRARLLSPFLEHFSTRFAYYQCRIALPLPHESAPAT